MAATRTDLPFACKGGVWPGDQAIAGFTWGGAMGSRSRPWVRSKKRMRADPAFGLNDLAGGVGRCALAQAGAHAIEKLANLRAEREDVDNGQERDASQDESVLCEPLVPLPVPEARFVLARPQGIASVIVSRPPPIGRFVHPPEDTSA